MTEIMGEWPSVHRKTEKPGHRMAAETIFFPRTGYGGMILKNLKVIWDMSAKLVCGDHGGVLVEDLVGATGLPVEATRGDRIPVSAIMTSDVICVQKDLSVEALTTLLLERGFSGAPVVDANGCPIGLVSKTDLVRERHDDGGLEEREPLCVCGGGGVEYELGPGFHAVQIARATVADIMMPIVFAVPENATVAKAAALMVFEGVHRVPVVSSGGQVVGVLSSLDILRWLAEHAGWLVGRTGRGKKCV